MPLPRSLGPCLLSVVLGLVVAGHASAQQTGRETAERRAGAVFAEGSDAETDADIGSESARGSGNSLYPIDGVTASETTIRFDHHDRRVLYLRPTTQKAGRVPALLMLHYHHGTPERMANLTLVGRLVRDYGIWVILPAGLNRSWNSDPRRDAWRTDDSGFLAAVIDQSLAAYPIDASRVYVAGFSLGGFMAERFACEHSERVAGAAWSSATLLNTLRPACAWSNPMPVISFHGTSDRRVKYDGKLGYASAPDTAAFFAAGNGCGAPTGSALPNIADDKTSVRLDEWTGCASGKPVRFYTVDGGGHTWPGNTYQGGLLGRTTHDIDATLLLWDFLSRYSR